MSSSDNKRIARNTLFLYARMLLILLVSLYTTRVVLNVLGVEDYGIYNVVAGFVSMFAFLNASMSNAVQRFYSFEKGHENGVSQKSVYNAALIIQVIIGAVTLLLLETIGSWYINNAMVMSHERLNAANWVFQCSVISLLVLILQIPYSAAIVAYERMDYFAYVGVADVILRLAIVFILPLASFDKLIFYGLLSVSVSLLDFLLYFVYVKKKFPELKVELSSGKLNVKSMLAFSGWNILDLVAYTLKNQGVNMLLNAFFNPLMNAARGIASQIMSAVTNFSKNIDTAFRPQLIEKYAEGDYARVQNLMFSLSNVTYACLLTLIVPLILEIDIVLDIWLNGVVPEYSSIFSILILINTLIDCFNVPLTQVVQAVGKLKNYQLYRSVLILGILPVSWLFLKTGCSPVVVFVVAISFSIANQPLSMYLLHRVFPYSYKEYFYKVLIPCSIYTLVSLIIPFVFRAILESGLFRLGCVIAASVISSGLSAFHILLQKEQRKMIVDFIKMKILRKRNEY